MNVDWNTDASAKAYSAYASEPVRGSQADNKETVCEKKWDQLELSSEGSIPKEDLARLIEAARKQKGSLPVNWDRVVDPDGRIYSAAYVEALLRQYTEGSKRTVEEADKIAWKVAKDKIDGLIEEYKRKNGIDQDSASGDIPEAEEESQKNYELASLDPKKSYRSIYEYADALFALQKKLQGQYREITEGSTAGTVEEMKKEIARLFPEYTVVSVRPKGVTAGKNLLYIDDANLQKMLRDPSYRADVYALMKRELAATSGYRVGNDTWKLTGTVFTLSEENSREGGIPYAGMCTGVRTGDSHTFSVRHSTKDIFSIAEKGKIREKDKKKNAEKRAEEKRERKRQMDMELAARKYEEQFLY